MEEFRVDKIVQFLMENKIEWLNLGLNGKMGAAKWGGFEAADLISPPPSPQAKMCGQLPLPFARLADDRFSFLLFFPSFP